MTPANGRVCRGPSRRDLIRVGLLGAFGLGLDDVFRLRARANDPYAPKTLPVKARSCILIWQAGGPSHIDTLDPKPDAPKDIKGEFAPIATSVPGVSISEVYPNLAKILDRVTLIRSMTSPEADHDRASHHLLTGYRPSPALVYPSYGSAVARSRGESPQSVLPPYVAVPDAPIFASSGYLTPAFDPFAVGGDPNGAGFRVRDLTPPDRLTLDRLRRRRSMVKALDGFARDLSETPSPAAATSSPTKPTTSSRRARRRPRSESTMSPNRPDPDTDAIPWARPASWRVGWSSGAWGSSRSMTGGPARSGGTPTPRTSP